MFTALCCHNRESAYCSSVLLNLLYYQYSVLFHVKIHVKGSSIQDNLLAFVINIRASKLCWITKPLLTILKILVKNVCFVGSINVVAGFEGLQGYKKPEAEESYISAKLTEKKKKSKGHVEDISQKVPLFLLQDYTFFKAVDYEMLQYILVGYGTV
jgi:hypothetical protein